MIAQSLVLLAEGAAPSPFDLGGMLPFILMIGVFWFLVLRPMSKQEKERKQRLSEIKRGDQIVLTGGLLGRVTKIEDDIVMVEIADKVRVRVLKKDITDFEDNARAKKDDKDDKKDDKKTETEGDEGDKTSRKAG